MAKSLWSEKGYSGSVKCHVCNKKFKSYASFSAHKDPKKTKTFYPKKPVWKTAPKIKYKKRI